MPAADAAWLHMDRPTNPMVVNALVRLAGVPELERVTAVIEERMVRRFPRFRQRVADPLGRTPAFEDDPFFEVGNHVHRRALPEPGDRAALETLVGELITPPLDPGKPLWHAYLIEGYGEGAALLWRIHHSIADGIALAEVMLSITDGPDAEMPRRPHRTHAEEDEGPHHGLLHDLVEGVRRDTATAAKLLASPPDAPTALRQPLSGTRRVAWTQPFPLQRVKDSCHRLRVTVNDMLLAALAATLAVAARRGRRAAGGDPRDGAGQPAAARPPGPGRARQRLRPDPARAAARRDAPGRAPAPGQQPDELAQGTPTRRRSPSAC